MIGEGVSGLALMGLAFAGLIIIADGLAAPHRRIEILPRSLAGISMLLVTAALALGAVLILTGAPLVAAALVTGMVAGMSLISNIKRKVLGEPLVFSDFALMGAVFQHPQFYLSALKPSQVVVLGGGLAGSIVGLALLSSAALAPRIAGLGLALTAAVGLAAMLRHGRRPEEGCLPDPERDVARDGLVAALLGQWHDWRKSRNPEPCDAPRITGQSRQLVVIVQCESFTDPVALFGDPALALPALEEARKLAWQAGRLHVSGFGAYTMRTEYGVLFGREERELGTRRFDPYLSAHGETSWALPNRLDPADWASWFVHPHDMRFYRRDRLLPGAGFGTLVGLERFAPPAPGEGRYVTDAAIADRIIDLAQDRSRAGLVYAVTIENHGPWPPAAGEGAITVAPYLRLLAHSDAMLARLLDELPRLGRPVTLCFFGDHRPSIPGASDPGPERHTPFVILRFASDGTPLSGSARDEDLTPAQLHHAILAAIRLGEAER